MKFDASLLVIMAIFWIAYVILRFSFFKPLLGILEQREGRVQSARATYEQAVADTDAAVAAERTKLQAARSAVAAHRDELRRQAADRRQAVLAETRQATQAELAAAQEKLAGDVARERATLASRAEELARRIASTLLGRTA